jgi:transposase-like protein
VTSGVTVTPPCHNGVMGMTVLQLADRLRDESDAYKFVEELRWPDGVAVCPHCDNPGATYIEPTNGKSRATRTGTQSQRRVWRCLACRKQFSVLTGTMMHGTKVPLRVWCLCIFEMVSSKNGVAAREIERKYGVCCRTAWHLMHRIREAMKDDLMETMRGVVIADETWIGGDPKWMHDGKKPGRQGVTNKTPILTLIDKERGEARSAVVPDVTGATLRKVISQQVDVAASTLHTDEWKGYQLLGREFLAHETVNHKAREFVRYSRDAFVSTNAAEGFFAQLKRSIDGTHHRVSVEHLPRYLAEFDYRYSTRKMSDTARMRKLMTQTGGKRLSYKRITSA